MSSSGGDTGAMATPGEGLLHPAYTPRRATTRNLSALLTYRHYNVLYGELILRAD